MRNPLTLPFAAVGMLAAIPRALAAVERGADLLEDAVIQAEGLNRRGDLILAELAAAHETVAEAMLKLDRLSAQGDRVLAESAAAVAALEAARPAAEEIAGRAQHMIDAAHAAREQLAESQVELARANDQITKALEMAEPLDRMTARAAKIAGSLRRDSG